jgi:hypothetical protein
MEGISNYLICFIFQQQSGEKSNYRLIGSSRRETTRFDEVNLIF